MRPHHRHALLTLATLALCASAHAVECPLERASYSEERSGAVVQFHPVDPATDGLSIVGRFDLRLPNIATALPGEIGWNAGRFARPDGAIARPCSEAARDGDIGACWLWLGGVYAIGNETAQWIEDPEMAAPNILLFADFGRSLLMDAAFATANPETYAFDVFMLNGCPGE